MKAATTTPSTSLATGRVPELGDPYEMADGIYSGILEHAVASLCLDAGFSSVDTSVLRTLSNLASNFIDDTSEWAKRLCEHSGRTHVTVRDTLLSLHQKNVLFDELNNTLRNLKQRPNYILPELSYACAPISQPSLRVGEPRPHPPHMPTFLPPFPDPHTYIHTEISGDLESNYEKVRRLTALNKRNTDNSLVSFALATRPTISLFQDYEDHLRAEAREMLERARQIKVRNLEARRSARSAQKLSRELENAPDANILMNDLLQEDDTEIMEDNKDEEKNLAKELEEEELFEMKDTEHSYVRRKIPDCCRILLPFEESRPYLSALVTEENLDDDANHYAKILSKEIEDELADVTDDFD